VAAATAISAGLSAYSASSAAGAQSKAGQEAIQFAQQLNQQTQQNEAPYLATGQQGNALLQQDLPSLSQGFNPTEAQLEATPGYQFQLQQGLESTQNGYAARGLGVSGAAMKGAASYATGLANENYTSLADIYNQNRTTSANILNAAAGIGQSAVGTIAGTGQVALGTTSNAITGIGNAQAAGDVGIGNAASNGLGNLAQSYLLYNSGLLQGGGAISPAYGQSVGGG
jgi:hypothetical protein